MLLPLVAKLQRQGDLRVRSAVSESRSEAVRASGVNPFIAFRPPLRHVAVPPPWGLNRRRPMISLLIGVGALILAVIACAIVDPRPFREDADDLTPTMD